MMNIPDAATLRKAIAITTEIERLQERLHALLTESVIKPKQSGSKAVLKKQKKSQALQQAVEEQPKVVSPSIEAPSLPLEPEGKNSELLLMEDDGQEQLALVSENKPES
ncbi:MAG: hypothetical protein K2W99_08090 [Chthoniobacterales bacterium]|nr:hypothetical protein [Chthoniobacterales bacterium]